MAASVSLSGTSLAGQRDKSFEAQGRDGEGIAAARRRCVGGILGDGVFQIKVLGRAQIRSLLVFSMPN